MKKSFLFFTESTSPQIKISLIGKTSISASITLTAVKVELNLE